MPHPRIAIRNFFIAVGHGGLQAEGMVAQLRAAGRAGDAAELERQMNDSDTDSEPEMLEVF